MLGSPPHLAFCIAVAFYAIELDVPVTEAMEATRQILDDVEVDDKILGKLTGYIMIVGPRLRDEWEQADAYACEGSGRPS